MNNISYRDIMVSPGEDIPFVISILFSSIHGCQRSRGASRMVVVPIFALDGQTFVWGKDGKLPNGFRVFAQSPDALEFDVSPRIDDAVEMKKIKTVNFDQDTPALIVKRLRDKDASYLRRQEKRRLSKNGCEDANNDLEKSYSKKTLSVRNDKFILLQKEKRRVPFFFDFDLSKGNEKFKVKNSYGVGVVPFIDFTN